MRIAACHLAKPDRFRRRARDAPAGRRRIPAASPRRLARPPSAAAIGTAHSEVAAAGAIRNGMA